jgi:hypothetical protein
MSSGMRARVVILLGMVSCGASDDLVAPVAGTFHSDHLGVTLTFPAGWTHERHDTSRDGSMPGTRVKSSKFLRGASILVPDVILLFDISDTPVESPPSADELVAGDERVFEHVVMAEHPEATRVGTCALIEGTLIDRCVLHSTGLVARTVADYTWYLEGKHVGMRVMSASADDAAVVAEIDAIAVSVH